MIATRMRNHGPHRAVRRAFAATLACIALAQGAPGLAGAQGFTEACKAEKIGPPMVDFGTAFAAADKRARAWQPDVVVVRLTHTSLGPIDADARSANWMMVWYSPGTKQRISITIANGGITCYSDTMAPGRLPALKSDVYRDVKQLLATAAAKGGAALMSDGAQPTVEMSAGPPSTGGKGLWYVNYRSKGGKSLQVTFDGSTGQFEKAID